MDNLADSAVETTETTAPNSTPAFEGPEWLSSMPDDLKESKSLGKFKDVENLARGYVNAEQLIGRDKLVMPKTDDEFREVYTRLGCPADVKEYKVTFDESKMSDATKVAMAQDLQLFLPWAKEAGLNNKQATAIFGKYAGQVSDMIAKEQLQIEIEAQDAKTILMGEYGEAYNQKLTLANRAIAAYGGKELMQAITDSGLGRNASFIKMMVRLGELSGEEVGIDKTGSSGVMTPNDIREQIAELQAHPAYLDAYHPEHKKVMERTQKLFERLAKKE